MTDSPPNASKFPKITIVTPSFNQSDFLEETILSVLDQDYPNLEYIIIDGGSTDASTKIIMKYESELSYWISEPDRGQSHAINKGFNKSTGVLGLWVSSDDRLCPGALERFIATTNFSQNKLYLGNGYQIDSTGQVIRSVKHSTISTLKQLLDIAHYWRGSPRDPIMQQSVLFPLYTYKALGGLNENLHFAMDYDLWGRMLLQGVEIEKIDVDIGQFRWYKGQKTSYEKKVTRELIETALKLLEMTNFSEQDRKILRKDIVKYSRKYTYHQLRSHIGIKRRFNQFFGHK